jgi:hypothetical protein
MVARRLSVVGTKRTSSDVRYSVVIGGKPDIDDRLTRSSTATGCAL